MDTAAGRPGEARAGRPGGAPPPLRSSGGPAAGLLRPAQAVKRESVPCATAMLPALSLPGRWGLCCGVGAGFCPLGGLVQGDRYGRRPPGRSPGRAPLRGASPLRSSGEPAAGFLRPAQAVKRESVPCIPNPGKHPLYLYRIAPPPGAFLHHGGRGGIGWCSGRPSRRPIDT